MASSLPPTPRTSVSASRPSALAPPDQLLAAQSCPSSAMPSPAPPTETFLAPSASAPASEAGTRDEPDSTIVEALNSTKDRLFVLKLGEDFDALLNERGNTPGRRCTYSPASSYQRLLVHRCAQYYRLAIDSDAKSISVMVGVESRVPKSRIAEIVPLEKAATPAFKIMRRSADERARAKQPGRSDSTEDDQGDGAAGIDEAKRRAQMTIEERTAAYEQARSRIFEGFQEKEAQSAPSPVKRDSGNAEPRWVDKQRRSDLSSSSRGSPIPQDGSIPAQYYPPMLYNPNAPSASVQSPQQYDPTGGQPVQYAMYGAQPAGYYPMYGYYPQPQYDPRQGPAGMQMGYPPPPQGSYPFPPQHAATWPQMQHSQPMPSQMQPQMMPQPQPQSMQAPVDVQRHAFPQMMHAPPQPPRQPPQMPNQMQGHMQMMPQQMQNDSFPAPQYMQPYQYNGFVHQPVLVPTPPEGPPSAHSSRSGSRNGHGQGHGSVGSNGGSAKGPRGSTHGTAWSTSTVATPMRSIGGMNRRLSASSSSTSAYSSSGGGAGSGSGSRTPADETASVASSTSSSSSRRTYTSTSTTSKHPLPPRPDWAVGLLPDPPLSRATSSSSNDSRLRLASRSSSGNQIPRTSSVKLNTGANTSDFPPLNGNTNISGSNGTPSNGTRAGAWTREGPPSTVFGVSMGPGGGSMGGNMGVGPNGPGGGLGSNSPGGNFNNAGTNASVNQTRFKETDSFGRPPPKSFGLYNPGTGTGPAALPAQVRNAQEGGINATLQTGSTDALAEQVAKMNVGEGGRVGSGA